MTIDAEAQGGGDAGAEREPSGLEKAVAAPIDPATDPGPGERSGLSSRIAEELLDDGLGPFEADEPGEATVPARAVEIDDPARAVGDDPAHPIHGSMAQEFEAR